MRIQANFNTNYIWYFGAFAIIPVFIISVANKKKKKKLKTNKHRNNSFLQWRVAEDALVIYVCVEAWFVSFNFYIMVRYLTWVEYYYFPLV
jgi:magnesium-transporting ATPase (P-type)